MSQFDRRQVLMGSGALAAAWLGAGPGFAASPRPPVARVEPVSETHFGVKVTDPYRWLENTQDPDWTPYLQDQGAYARSVLEAIPGRDALAAKIGALSGVTTAVSRVQAAGRYIFTQVRPEGANTYKLFVREGRAGKDRLLFDPDTRATASTHYSIDYWLASPDGSHVLIGVSPGGSEDSVIEILETASGRALPERLDRAALGSPGPGWLPDGSGFFCLRGQVGRVHGTLGAFEDNETWLHRLGSDTSVDVKVAARGLDSSVPMQPIDYAFVTAPAGSHTALNQVVRGVGVDNEFYVAPLAPVKSGKARWSRAAAFADEVEQAVIKDDKLYLLSRKNASRRQVLATNAAAPDISTAKPVIAQSELVLVGLSAARDGVYVQALEAGIGQLLRLGPRDEVTRLKMPFPGTVTGLGTDPATDGCWFILQSWARAPAVCFGSPDGTVTITDIATAPRIDLSHYESREVIVTARDGVKVPLSIVYRKGTRRDGSAPLYLRAYGAYGVTVDPVFSPSLLPWLDLGGVFAVAHVRGGGERGEDWHRAGQKLTKPNTWRDCIDCARWLIAEKWTTGSKLAVEGASAGGVMVSRFLTEAPELPAVAIVRMGLANATRQEFGPTGPANVPEFGSLKDPDEFRGLLEMDGYQHVRDGAAYPAVLLVTGAHDPRVAPWQLMKMTARLQAATSSGKPVILRVEADGGHGIGSTRTQLDVERADTYAFILSQTGDPRFQPGAVAGSVRKPL